MKRGVKKHPGLEASEGMKVRQAAQLRDAKGSGGEGGTLGKTGNLAAAGEERRSRGSDWLKDDLERIWERWLKGRRDLPSFSPIRLDATNHFDTILLKHALSPHEFLPYWLRCSHLWPRYHHQTGQAILGSGQERSPDESTGDS